MTLASQTIEQLKSLGPLHGRRETLRVEQEGVRVECDLVAADSLSCSFSELRLEVPGHVDDAADALNHWADALSRRVTYLLEGLERLETDVESGTVMLRSSPPEKTAEHTHYYELLLQRGGHLRLRRYRTGPEGGRRAEVACTCTHEQVAKLVDDLVRSARKA